MMVNIDFYSKDHRLPHLCPTKIRADPPDYWRRGGKLDISGPRTRISSAGMSEFRVCADKASRSLGSFLKASTQLKYANKKDLVTMSLELGAHAPVGLTLSPVPLELPEARSSLYYHTCTV